MPVASPFQLRIQQMHNHEKLLSLQVNEFTIKTKIPQLGNNIWTRVIINIYHSKEQKDKIA
jgi:hypothetical protein